MHVWINPPDVHICIHVLLGIYVNLCVFMCFLCYLHMMSLMVCCSSSHETLSDLRSMLLVSWRYKDPASWFCPFHLADVIIVHLECSKKHGCLEFSYFLAGYHSLESSRSMVPSMKTSPFIFFFHSGSMHPVPTPYLERAENITLCPGRVRSLDTVDWAEKDSGMRHYTYLYL